MSQRLVGGDMDTGVLRVVGAVWLAEHLGSVRAKDILESFQRLAAEFVAVAHKQGARELSGIGDALEQIDGDEGLTRAGGQCEQRALGCPVVSHCAIFSRRRGLRRPDSSVASPSPPG